MIAEHAPILLVVVPLISAAVCVLLRHPDVVWAFAALVCWAVFGLSITVLVQVLEGGTISYAIGGWAPPWGIEYRIDALAALVQLIVAGIGAVTAVFAHQSIRHEIPERRIYLVYALYLLCLTGLLGISVTGDAFNLFVFLEISSLSSYALISLGPTRRALTAAFQYLVMGTLGATFILIGVGLLYMITGTLNMADLADRLAEPGRRTALVAFAFLTVGTSLKLALFPLHLWLPNAYAYAPSTVTAFLAATATKVSVYVLLRFFFTVFGVEFSFVEMPVGTILLVLAITAVFAASTVAIFQDDVKRLLAYSSVAQIGYMILGISIATVNGLTAGIVHLFNHALIKGGLFMALGGVFLRVGSVRIEAMTGLGRRMPLTMAAFVAGGLSLIGIPLTSGFISKWYLVAGALDKNWWPVAALIVLGSLLAVVYVWRVIEAAYFRDAPAGAPPIAEAPLAMLVPTWTLIGANLYFGINSSLPVGISRQAAMALLGLGQ